MNHLSSYFRQGSYITWNWYIYHNEPTYPRSWDALNMNITQDVRMRCDKIQYIISWVILSKKLYIHIRSYHWHSCRHKLLNTGLFKMIVGDLTTCHIKYTWDSSIYIFVFNRKTIQVFATYLTGALYVHPLWFYKHQHDNRFRSACQLWWFQWRFWFVPSFPGYTRTLSLETVHTTFEWNCQMVVVSRIWCGIAAGQLFPDNHFEIPCTLQDCNRKSWNMLVMEYRRNHKKQWEKSCLTVHCNKHKSITRHETCRAYNVAVRSIRTNIVAGEKQ